MKILIAEDDAVSRRLLERKLVMWGYEVVTCQNGVDAWQRLQRDDSPSLAILNWMMPGMDGVQICRQVRDLKRRSYIYIILLTARDQKEDIVEGIDAGADDYVTKPFNPHELNVRVRAGRRVLEMHAELLQREKLRGVVEMAGATCHEFNQPMQVISGYAELLMKEVPASDPIHVKIARIKEATEVMAQITGKLQQITRYETREYYDGMRIIDIDKASQLAAEEAGRETVGKSEATGVLETVGKSEATGVPEIAAPPTCGWR